jgi:GrpB-like predicted nucleotidyltransferase (UPF0157 family)
MTPDDVLVSRSYSGVVPDPIVIVDYDLEWQVEFERLRQRAARAIGEVALSIEHVGSTAVPGLAAKPVIDLVVVVRPGEVGVAIERLAAIGYVYRGDLGVEGREAFGVPTGERRHHLYVCPEDSGELLAQLAFRDRLRNEPELASAYADLKRQLAIRFRDDREAYTEAKTEFVTAAIEL